MTPTKRRNQIRNRMEALGVTVHKMIIKSEYAGVRGYVYGLVGRSGVRHFTKAADEYVYAMEQALASLEKAKADGGVIGSAESI